MKEIIKHIGGEAGIYAENLTTGKTYLYNEKKIMPSASVIKLPVLACLYEFISEKNIDSNSFINFQESDLVDDSPFFAKSDLSAGKFTIYDIAHSMITVSDNTSTNLLIDYLGFDRINEFIKNIGMSDTQLNRKMCDFETRKKGIDNLSTAEDMAIFFKYILTKTTINPFDNYLVNNQYDVVLKILLEQNDLEKIPAGFKEDSFKVANKPGELPDIRNDAAIIFTKTSTSIINIFTENVLDENNTDVFISKLARNIFEEIS